MEQNIPIAQPPVTEPVSEQKSEAKNPFSKWLLVFAGLVLLTILFSGVYFLGIYQGMSQKPAVKAPTTTQKVVKSTPTPASNAAIADPTANWKTYDGAHGLFSIKYPLGYSVLDTTIDNYSSLIEAQKVSGNHFSIISNYGTSKSAGGDVLPTELKLEASVFGNFNKSLDEWVKSDWGTNLIKTEDIAINGKPAKKVWGKSRVGGTGEILSVYYISGTYAVQFNCWPYNSNYLKQCDQMISTFKFTDQAAQTDEATTWKTYTSTTFSLKYPQDWFVSMYAENSPEAVEISDVKNSPTAIIGESDTHTRIQVNYISGVMPSCFPYTNGGAGCVNSTIKPFSINSYSGIKGQAGSVAGLMDVTYLRNPNASGYISIILFPPQQNSTTAQDIYNSILSNFKFTQ